MTRMEFGPIFSATRSRRARSSAKRSSSLTTGAGGVSRINGGTDARAGATPAATPLEMLTQKETSAEMVSAFPMKLLLLKVDLHLLGLRRRKLFLFAECW